MKIKSFKHVPQIEIFLFGAIVVTLCLALFVTYKYFVLTKELRTISATNASTTATLEKTTNILGSLIREKSTLLSNLQSEQARNDAFEAQINGLSSTVGVLDKLSKTDKELLAKYSNVFFLNENYVPKQLSQIDPQYLFSVDKPLQIEARVKPFLQALLQAAQESGEPMSVLSAYRSFGTQANLKAAYRVVYGAGTANQFSADQGYSEHQLGTAVDFTTQTTGSALSGFEKTPQYAWLEQNAYKYGFVLSYPKGNKFYIFEPWHWRYVGVELATFLHNTNRYFYDLDQREIDQYLVKIFD